MFFVHLAFFLFAARRAHAASDISPKFWNHYRGLSYKCAMAKEPLQRCELRLSIDTHGVVMDQYIGDRVFRVRYGRKWILSPQEAEQSGGESTGHGVMYGLRKNLRSNRLYARLEFIQDEHNQTRVASVSGRAPIPLAVYYVDKPDASNLIREQYDKVMAILTSVYSQSAESLESNKPTRTLAEKINRKIQIAVATIERYSKYKQFQPHDRQHLDFAVSSAVSLLEEVHQKLNDQSQLLQRFGTTDLDRIYLKTHGRVPAELVRLVEFAAHLRSNEMSWTTDQFSELVRALNLIVQSYDLFGGPEFRRAAEALQTYADPFGSCANVLKHNGMLAH